ncbi:PP2C family protein-serine/threonine phosphatase [Streptomyces sp. NPDC005576]|uniref:PP2C family protein-serine/threonine phosphatase n=1 Tax=unclassified Streptomyces TaxID=2593676 RepID=UPI00340643A3
MTRRRNSAPASAADLLGTLQQLTARARQEVELHQARVELAEALQRTMLPGALPSVPGLQTAARYQPTHHGLDIGGDWYDGFALPDGALGFAIGDVQGHDVEAAAVMGQIRIAMRAIAGSISDPGEVMRRTNDLMMAVTAPLFATCTFLRVDPAGQELHSARAGHVASVWATVDGRSGIAEGPGGLPLGIMGGEVYPVTRRRLDVPGAVVLLTDGLVEGPSLDLDEGLDAIRRLVSAHVTASAEELAQTVLGAADMTGHEDDVAFLVLRHGGGPDG